MKERKYSEIADGILIKNPFVDDDVEDILLQRYLLKCVSLPNSEYQYDHLIFLFLYGCTID